MNKPQEEEVHLDPEKRHNFKMIDQRINLKQPMIKHPIKKLKVRLKCLTVNKKVGRINMLLRRILRSQLEVLSKNKREAKRKKFTRMISMKMLQNRMKLAAAGHNAV
jgi:hypothetical protein